MSTDRRHPLPRTQTLCAAFFLFAPLAAIAQVGLGETKVTICHIPPGNPANLHEIVVGAPAQTAHLAHGDLLGSCACSGEGVLCGSNLPHCCGGLECTAGFCLAPASGAMPLGGACTSDAQCGLNQCVFLGPDDGVCGG